MGLGDWFSGLADRAMDGVSKAIGGGVKNWIREKVPGASFFLGGSETTTPGASGSNGGFLGDLGGKLLGAAKGEGMSLIGQIGLAFVAAMAGKHFGGGSFLMAAAIAVVTFIAGSMMMGSAMSGGSQKPAAPGAGRQVDGQTRGQSPTLGQQTGVAAPQPHAQVLKAADQYNFPALEARHGLSSGLLSAVMHQESCGDPNALGPVTRNGQRAQGAFQFMPGTAAECGVTNPFDVSQAAPAAAGYLQRLKQKYNGDEKLALAAYNWGQGNLDNYLKNGGNIPAETQNYVARITAMMPHYEAASTTIAQRKGGDTQYAAAGTGSQPLSLTPREAAAAAIRKASFSSNDAITGVADATTPSQTLATPAGASGSGGGLGQKSPSGSHA